MINDVGHSRVGHARGKTRVFNEDTSRLLSIYPIIERSVPLKDILESVARYAESDRGNLTVLSAISRRWSNFFDCNFSDKLTNFEE